MPRGSKSNKNINIKAVNKKASKPEKSAIEIAEAFYKKKNYLEAFRTASQRYNQEFTSTEEKLQIIDFFREKSTNPPKPSRFSRNSKNRYNYNNDIYQNLSYMAGDKIKIEHNQVSFEGVGFTLGKVTRDIETDLLTQLISHIRRDLTEQHDKEKELPKNNPNNVERKEETSESISAAGRSEQSTSNDADVYNSIYEAGKLYKQAEELEEKAEPKATPIENKAQKPSGDIERLLAMLDDSRQSAEHSRESSQSKNEGSDINSSTSNTERSSTSDDADTSQSTDKNNNKKATRLSLLAQLNASIKADIGNSSRTSEDASESQGKHGNIDPSTSDGAVDLSPSPKIENSYIPNDPQYIISNFDSSIEEPIYNNEKLLSLSASIRLADKQAQTGSKGKAIDRYLNVIEQSTKFGTVKNDFHEVYTEALYGITNLLENSNISNSQRKEINHRLFNTKSNISNKQLWSNIRGLAQEIGQIPATNLLFEKGLYHARRYQGGKGSKSDLNKAKKIFKVLGAGRQYNILPEIKDRSNLYLGRLYANEKRVNTAAEYYCSVIDDNKLQQEYKGGREYKDKDPINFAKGVIGLSSLLSEGKASSKTLKKICVYVFEENELNDFNKLPQKQLQQVLFEKAEFLVNALDEGEEKDHLTYRLSLLEEIMAQAGNKPPRTEKILSTREEIQEIAVNKPSIASSYSSRANLIYKHRQEFSNSINKNSLNPISYKRSFSPIKVYFRAEGCFDSTQEYFSSNAAIVNAANQKLENGSGVAGMTFKLAGNELADEINNIKEQLKIESVAVGSSTLTSSYNLKDTTGFNNIIHTVGPDYRNTNYISKQHTGEKIYAGYNGADSTTKPEPQDMLAIAYYNTFKTAIENGIEVVSVPLISGGYFSGKMKNYLPDMTINALNIAVKQIQNNYHESQLNIVISCADKLQKKTPALKSDNLSSLALNHPELRNHVEALPNKATAKDINSNRGSMSL